jgi:hypothetical protein
VEIFGTDHITLEMKGNTMSRHAITAMVLLLAWAATTQAEIVSVTQKAQRRLQLGGHDIFFTGRNIGAGVPYGYQDSMAFEVDLDTRMARVTEATFRYEPVSRTVSHTRDYTRSVAQPWPDPPIVETTTITESMTFSWGGVSGSFAPTDWAPLLDPYQPRFVFPLVSENPVPFSLIGTYRVVGSRDSFTRDFTYTIEEVPTSTLAVIQGFHASAVPAMYRLVPSQSTINATVDGVEFSARLNTLRIPVTVPEPSGLFLAGLAGLGLWRRR